MATLLDLPAELREILWENVIQDKIVCCQPYMDTRGVIAGVCDRLHKPPSNPNLNLLLVSKDFSAKVASYLPRAFHVEFSAWTCARVYLILNGPKLLRHTRSFAYLVNRYTESMVPICWNPLHIARSQACHRRMLEQPNIKSFIIGPTGLFVVVVKPG